MGKEKKRRERAVMPCDFTMLCDVATKLCTLCGCVCVCCVSLGVCGLWEGLRPPVSTRSLSAAGLLVSRHWTCQCSLGSRKGPLCSEPSALVWRRTHHPTRFLLVSPPLRRGGASPFDSGCMLSVFVACSGHPPGARRCTALQSRRDRESRGLGDVYKRQHQ